MKFAKSIIKFLSVIVAVSAIGYLTYIRVEPLFRDEKENLPEKTSQNKEKKKQTINIQAGYAFKGKLIMNVTAQGMIKALREVPIIAKTSGEIMKVNVFEGKTIRKGTLVAALDTVQSALSLRESNNALLEKQVSYVLQNSTALNTNSAANGNTSNTTIDNFVENSLKEWENAKSLLNSGGISKSEYDQRERNANAANALSGQDRNLIAAIVSNLTGTELAYEKAVIDHENTKLFSTISGEVAKLSIQEGQRISSGTEICVIVDRSKVRIEAYVLESEISDITIGRTAYVTLPAYQNERFEGKVETISPVVENKTNKVTIIVDNEDKRLKPGMFAFVEIEGKIYEDKLLVPIDAVLTRDQKDLVLVVREKRTAWSYITRGMQNSRYVEVLTADQGLEHGELLAVSEHFTLGHDIPVKIINTPEMPKEAYLRIVKNKSEGDK